MIRGWRARYHDGHVGARYSSREYRPQELPPDGMVGVVEYMEPPYRRIVDGGNWYVWDGSRWRKVGDGADDGRWGPKPEGVAVIRSAPSLPDDVWAGLQREMMEAREWPGERS